jgi:hypothetical protein
MLLASRMGIPFALVVLTVIAAQAPGPTEAVVPAAAAAAARGLPPPPAAVAPDGAPLFTDDFRTLDSWQTDREGVWSVADGVLCGHLPDGRQQRSFLVTGSDDWQDYAVDVDVCQVRGVDKGVAVCVRGGRGVAVDLRGGGYQDVLLYRQEVPLGSAKVANADSAWHHLRVETRGARYGVRVNGARVLERRDPLRSMRRGRVALVAYTGGHGECAVLYANLFVTRLAPAR